MADIPGEAVGGPDPVTSGRHTRHSTRRRQKADGYDDWFRREVQVGLDSAIAGHLVTADVVEEKFAARRAETRRQIEQI